MPPCDPTVNKGQFQCIIKKKASWAIALWLPRMKSVCCSKYCLFEMTREILSFYLRNAQPLKTVQSFNNAVVSRFILRVVKKIYRQMRRFPSVSKKQLSEPSCQQPLLSKLVLKRRRRAIRAVRHVQAGFLGSFLYSSAAKKVNKNDECVVVFHNEEK